MGEDIFRIRRMLDPWRFEIFIEEIRRGRKLTEIETLLYEQNKRWTGGIKTEKYGEIIDNGNKYILVADMCDSNLRDIDISVSVYGKKINIENRIEDSCFSNEFPGDVKSETVRYTCKNGVLEINIEKE